MSSSSGSSWAKIAAQKIASNSSQQVPVTQQTSTSASASTTSAGKDDALSTSAATSAPASVAEVNEASKSEAQESTANTTTDPKKAVAANTLGDEISTHSSGVTTRDEEASIAGSHATSAERNNKSSSSSARGHDDSNSRKSRKPKRSRNAEKEEREQAAKPKEAETEPVKTVELREATLPTVNIWKKRIEAQAAKKQTPATTPAAADKAASVNGISKPSAPRPGAGAAGPATETLGMNGSASASGKPQRQPAETPRVNGDQQPKRNAPRGSRVAEKEDKPAVNGTVPPVDDATSWPTPATTIEDKKTKNVPVKEPADDDAQPSKPAQKTTWQSMPFVPSVNFQTPLPNNVKGSKPRGGGRGGREASGRGGHSAPAGSQQTADKAVAGQVTNTPKGSESREKKEVPGASTQAPNSAKRVGGDAGNTRDQRKSVSPPNHNRSREHPVVDGTAEAKKSDTVVKSTRNEHVNGEPATAPHESLRRSPDHANHSGFTPSKDGPQPNRERGEGRNERGGRGGGYRRGGAHGNQGHVSQQQYTFSNPRFPSNPPFPQAGAPPFNSPPAHFGYGAPPASKHGRGNARSQSLSTTNPYGNQGSSARNIQRMPSLQTQGSGYYDPQYHMGDPTAHQYPMSAGPIPYAMDNTTPDIMLGIQTQVEFYFSAQNMVSDVYLRSHMDSQGFVPLETIASFPRLQKLVPQKGWLVAACANSEKLDFVIDEHGLEFLRARGIWDHYPLEEHLRVEAARHNGPDLGRILWRSGNTHTHRPGVSSPTNSWMVPQMYSTTSPGAMGGYPPMTNGADGAYSPFNNGVRADMMINGNGTHGAGHHESQLSATVPDFSPSIMQDRGMTMAAFQKISDEDVEKLTVNVPDIEENGARGSSSESSSDDKSVKNITYPEFRSRAYDARLAAQPGTTPLSTRQLYYWWTVVLAENFNITMYEAFRSLAIEDAKFEAPRLHGITKLVSFYKGVMDGNPESQYPGEFISHREEADTLLRVQKPVVNGSAQN